MTRYFIEPRIRKHVKGYGLLSVARNLSDKYVKKVIGYCYKNRTRSCKKKNAEKIVKPQFVSYVISRDVERIVITPEKRQEIVNKLRQVLHPFRSCISRINNTLMDIAEDLGTVSPKYNLYNILEYSNNYSMTSGSLWNYYKGEIYVFKNNALWSKSFEYKIKITGETPGQFPQPRNE